MRTNLTTRHIDLLIAALNFASSYIIEDQLFESWDFKNEDEAEREINATLQWLYQQKDKRNAD